MDRRITIADKYAPAMKVKTQAEADAYLEECVQHAMGFGRLTRPQAEFMERTNIAYYAGYGDAEQRERVERLYKCAHPWLGAIAKTGQLSAEEIMEIGEYLGREYRDIRFVPADDDTLSIPVEKDPQEE